MEPGAAPSPPLQLLGAVSVEMKSNITPCGGWLGAAWVGLGQSIQADLWLIL